MHHLLSPAAPGGSCHVQGNQDVSKFFKKETAPPNINLNWWKGQTCVSKFKGKIKYHSNLQTRRVFVLRFSKRRRLLVGRGQRQNVCVPLLCPRETSARSLQGKIERVQIKLSGHTLKKMSSPFMIVIDAHTQAVEVYRCKTCKTCKDIKRLETDFYRGGAVNKRVDRCKPCYDAYWMHRNDVNAKTSLEVRVGRKVGRANARSRYRKAAGVDLTVEEALAAWTGACNHCHTGLTFDWQPRCQNINHAVIDRVDTSSNASYSKNFQWMCWSCNNEKSGWDLVDQKNKEIEKLEQEIHRLKRKRKRKQTPYESALINWRR